MNHEGVYKDVLRGNNSHTCVTDLVSLGAALVNLVHGHGLSMFELHF